jgi:hypothetical protein
MRELLKAAGILALALLLGLGYLWSYGPALRHYNGPTAWGMPRWLSKVYWPADVLIGYHLMPHSGYALVDRYRGYLLGCALQYEPIPPALIPARPNPALQRTAAPLVILGIAGCAGLVGLAARRSRRGSAARHR